MLSSEMICKNDLRFKDLYFDRMYLMKFRALDKAYVVLRTSQDLRVIKSINCPEIYCLTAENIRDYEGECSFEELPTGTQVILTQ